MINKKGWQDHWEKEFKSQLDGLGITYPDDIPYEDLKELARKHRPKRAEAAKGKEMPADATKEDIKASVKEATDARILEMHERMAQMERLIRSQGIQPQQVSPANLDLVTALRQIMEGRDGAADTMIEQHIPPEDVLETPVVFYTPTQNWNIWNKAVGAHRTRPPFNWPRIPFKMARAFKEPSGPSFKQRFIATFECSSSTILKWLRTHEAYNSIFYEEVDRALESDVNMDFVQLFVKYSGACSGMTHAEITKQLRGYGFATRRDDSREVLLGELSRVMANQELEGQKSLLRKHSERNRQTDLLQATGALTQ